MPPADDSPRSPHEVLAHYRRLRRTAPGARPMQEAALESMVADIAEGDVSEAEKALRAQLHRIVRTYLGDKPELHEIADKLASDGSAGLAAFASGDGETLSSPDILAGFETIVRTDGTRPSFMIRDGVPDLATSPAGDWAGAIEMENNHFRAALACVGRIDDPSQPQGFGGTGTLIAPNLVLTNRHVLQSIAKERRRRNVDAQARHRHRLRPRVQGRASLNPRKVRASSSPAHSGSTPTLSTTASSTRRSSSWSRSRPGLPEPRCLPLDCTGALDAPTTALPGRLSRRPRLRVHDRRRCWSNYFNRRSAASGSPPA